MPVPRADLGVVIAFSDITRQKATEAALKDSERRLEAILHPMIGAEAQRQAEQGQGAPVVFDVPLLAEHFLRRFAESMSRRPLKLAADAQQALQVYSWPGNVRELANEMRRLVALAEPDAVLMPEHLSPVIAASRRTLPPSERRLEANEFVVRVDQPIAAAFQHVERTMIPSALARTKSVDEAARMLGLSRKGLYLKRLRLGLDIERAANDESEATN